MIKALLIAPYQGLVETARKVPLPENFQLDMKAANLEEAVEIARSAEKEGYDLIISRGGTATLVQEVVSIPVIHIEITGYDMLRVFTLIREIKEGVALVGFPDISRGAAALCSILELDVKVITIHSSGEVRRHLEELKQNGYSVVIGDVITVQVAEQVGLRGVLITSGKEAVLDAVEEGKRMDRLFRKVTHHAGFLEQAYNSLPFPFVLLNGNGDITEHNKKFNEEKTLLNIEEHNLSHLAKQVLETGKNQWDQLETEGKLYDLQAFPVSEEAAVVGMIIQPAPFVPGKKALSIISSPAHLPIIGDSRFTRELRKAIRQYAETGMSICITGEPGTGKRTIAQAIHFEKFGKDAPIIEVRGKSVSPDELAELQTKLSFVKKGTVLISNTDELNETAQIALSVLLDNKPEEMKVICLSGRPIEILVHKEKFDSELYEKITVHSLHCPPLRERKDDISAFVTYFIAELHTEAGNEILGMKQEAVQYLEELDWKGNLTQLRQVIRELSFMTSVYYIELGHVQDLMRNFQTSEHPKESDGLPLTGTLKEMEHKIIKQVMEEEGNNQTKAAKRLGINRSTLWRKLNDTE